MASATIHALMMNRRILNFSRVFLLLLCAAATQAQTRITTPNEQFGFNIGDDYVLVNYTQYVDYLKKLSRESDRLKLEEIGKSSEGRTIYLAIISSPENQNNLARYKEISRRLAAAEGLGEDQARTLAAEGKAVVWIDGGLHATEILGAQQLIENIYQLVSRTDPETLRFLDEVGAAMHSRFAMEGKPGVTSRSGANYSTWWNGGLRTSPYFHNQIGLLTETIGNPAPVDIPFVVEKALPQSDLPLPINPQKWHFRQSIEYSITANRAVIDYASRNKDRLLFDVYKMGLNSIERGSRDTWTTTPRHVQGANRFDDLRDPTLRDSRGYIIPSDQSDFLTATKFVNALIKNGVTVHRATAQFMAGGRMYPAGSYVVKTAQAFRPQVLDMFEPQDHPNDFAYAGAPPTPPYDIAGWTLAYQMGVKFDRILDAFDGPFQKVGDEVKPPAGKVTGAPNPAGYLFSHEVNDTFLAVNRLLAMKEKEDVYWLKNSFTDNGKTYPPGTQFIPAKP